MTEVVGNFFSLGRACGRQTENHRDGMNPCGGPRKVGRAHRGKPEGSEFQYTKKELREARENSEASEPEKRLC